MLANIDATNYTLSSKRGTVSGGVVLDHEMVRVVRWNEFDIEAAWVKPTE